MEDCRGTCWVWMVNSPSLGHGIEGIGDEIEKEGLEMGRIAEDQREDRRESEVESRHIPGMKPGFTQMDQFLQDAIHIQGISAEGWAVG